MGEINTCFDETKYMDGKMAIDGIGDMTCWKR